MHTLIFCSAGVEAEHSGLATTLKNTLLLSQYRTCATEDTRYVVHCLKGCKSFPGEAYLQKSMSHLLAMGGSSQFLNDVDDFFRTCFAILDEWCLSLVAQFILVSLIQTAFIDDSFTLFGCFLCLELI